LTTALAELERELPDARQLEQGYLELCRGIEAEHVGSGIRARPSIAVPSDPYLSESESSGEHEQSEHDMPLSLGAGAANPTRTGSWLRTPPLLMAAAAAGALITLGVTERLPEQSADLPRAEPGLATAGVPATSTSVASSRVRTQTRTRTVTTQDKSVSDPKAPAQNKQVAKTKTTTTTTTTTTTSTTTTEAKSEAASKNPYLESGLPEQPGVQPEPVRLSESQVLQAWPSGLEPGQARLNINSFPVANVVLNGRPLGNTPLVSVPVKPGVHTILFVHPELGRKRQRVKVSAGGTVLAAVRFR
jgi:hypothetical protein